MLTGVKPRSVGSKGMDVIGVSGKAWVSTLSSTSFPTHDSM